MRPKELYSYICDHHYEGNPFKIEGEDGTLTIKAMGHKETYLLAMSYVPKQGKPSKLWIETYLDPDNVNTDTLREGGIPDDIIVKLSEQLDIQASSRPSLRR